MKCRKTLLVLALLAVGAAAGFSYLKQAPSGVGMTESAQTFLATLAEEQRAQTLLPYDTPKRVGWHFIPKAERKGLQIREMDQDQRKAAHALLRSSLSEVGYDKSTQIMALEHILHELEKQRPGGSIRDPERYYFTVFGPPTDEGRWGLSVEGHHLSLNFVVDRGRVSSSTPSFMGANPALVKTQIPDGLKKGTRVLAQEEQLGFKLLGSLSDDQRQTALIAKKAPADIRAGGEPQPPQTPPEGLPAAKMNEQQVKTLRALIAVYAHNMPPDVAQQRVEAIEKAGLEKIHFAWAGADEPGIGHYYRLQGPTFLVEFVNVQPDAEGNPANHIHCVWRDPAGDFDIAIK